MNKRARIAFILLALVFFCVFVIELLFFRQSSPFKDLPPGIILLFFIFSLLSFLCLAYGLLNSDNGNEVRRTVDTVTRFERSAFLPITGEFLLTDNEKLIGKTNEVVDALVKALQKERIKDIEVHGNRINFKAARWGFDFAKMRSRWHFSEMISWGELELTSIGREVHARYRFSVMTKFLLNLAPVVLFLVYVAYAAEDPGFLKFFVTIMVLYTIGSYLYIKYAGIKTFQRDLQSAVKLSEPLVSAYNTGEVESEHREFGPGDLMRTAYYYRSNGFPEKAKAYYALILKKYNGTPDAETAHQELEDLSR